MKSDVFCRSEADLEAKNLPKWGPESIKKRQKGFMEIHGEKVCFFDPKMTPKWSKNGAKINENVIQKRIQK